MRFNDKIYLEHLELYLAHVSTQQVLTSPHYTQTHTHTFIRASESLVHCGFQDKYNLLSISSTVIFLLNPFEQFSPICPSPSFLLRSIWSPWGLPNILYSVSTANTVTAAPPSPFHSAFPNCTHILPLYGAINLSLLWASTVLINILFNLAVNNICLSYHLLGT